MSKNNLIKTIKDLNGYINNNLYLLCSDDTIIGSTNKTSINKYLCSAECLIDMDEARSEDVKVIHGMVLNHLNLPLELPPSLIDQRSIWLFSSDDCHSLTVETEEFNDLDSAISSIESLIDGFDIVNEHNIDDFAIVVGEEIELSVQIMEAGRPMDPRQLRVFES